MTYRIFFTALIFIISLPLIGQKNDYGRIHPDAPSQLADYASLIGMSDCKSVSRNGDGTWADTVQMTWKFKYIMDGKAVQDETIKEDGIHSGSIRQYNQDSARWYVHYYSSGGIPNSLPAWEGNLEGDEIILFRDQPAPNGTPGDYRITFLDITDKGFNWKGEWVNKGRNFVYPTWNIYCKMREE